MKTITFNVKNTSNFIVLILAILCSSCDVKNNVEKTVSNAKINTITNDPATQADNKIPTKREVIDEQRYQNLLSKNSSDAFDDQEFKNLFEEITKPQDRETIQQAGWDDFKVIKINNLFVGQGMLPRSAGWGLCGGGVYIIDPIKNTLSIHICNHSEVSSYGKDTSIDYIKNNYPPEVQKWFCETYVKPFRDFLKCE